MATLVYTDSLGEEHVVDLDEDAITIGRLETNDIVIEDNLVSRQHCKIEPRTEDLLVVDLGSTYGTFINDQKVDPEAVFGSGDVLRVGRTEFRLHTPGGAYVAEPPPNRGDTKPLVRAALADIAALCEQLEHEIGGGSKKEAQVLTRTMAERILDATTALEDLETSQRLHRTLSEVGKLISAVTDLATVIRLTMELAVSVLGADRGFILLRDAEGTLTPRATHNMDREVRALVRRGISQSIAHDVAQSARPVLTTDARLDPRFKESESVMAHDIRAVMCVPMRNKSMDTIGTIYVDGPPGNTVFSQRGLSFLQAFASQAAVAIENAQLQEKIKLEEKLRGRLSRYFSPNVVEDILAGTEQLTTKGTSRVVTVLFTDIRGSTQILEKLKPSEAVEMLNDFFEEVVEEVRIEDGTLDKFTGDGFMAFWGAPKEQEDHAVRAVRAALRMQEKLPALIHRWAREKRSFATQTQTLAIGIGIHTGEVVVGDVGSSRRIEYTAIGDAVNVTARIQGCARGHEILVTDATARLVEDSVKLETLDPVQVKGKSDPIPVFRVLGLKRA